MPLKTFHLFLDEIKINENGRSGGKTAQNLLMVSLIWPRPRIEERTTPHMLHLEDNQTIKYKNRPFDEKIIFKESIEDDFGIRVEVTERRTPTQFQNLLSKIIGSAVRSAWPMPASADTALRLVRSGTIRILENVDPKEKVRIIGAGSTFIKHKPTQNGKIKIPLTVPDDIKDRRHKLLLKQGEPNGHVSFTYRIEK